MNTSAPFKHYFSISLIIHIIVLMVLIISFDWGMPSVLKNADKDMKMVNATVMDAPPGPLPPPKTKVVVPQPIVRPVPPPSPQKIIAKPAPILKPVMKPAVIAIPDARKKKREQLEKQLMSELEKEVQQQKKMKHQLHQKSVEKKMKAQALAALSEDLMRESNRVAAIQSQQMQGIVDRYKALILQAISYHWLVPPTVNRALTCELLIRTAPGGLVLEVQIVKSSGDMALDRSARVAVFKSSPLPVPTETAAYEPFKQFILKVKPENLTQIN